MRSEYDSSLRGRKSAENSPTNSLTRRKEQAIGSLLAHKSMAEVARECKISERTLRRWMKNRSFNRRYCRERNMMLEGVVDALKQSAVECVEILLDIARNKKNPVSARVSATGRILDLNFKCHESLSLERRLAQLEQLATEKT
jgi:hypothetical protein